MSFTALAPDWPAQRGRARPRCLTEGSVGACRSDRPRTFLLRRGAEKTNTQAPCSRVPRHKGSCREAEDKACLVLQSRERWIRLLKRGERGLNNSILHEWIFREMTAPSLPLLCTFSLRCDNRLECVSARAWVCVHVFFWRRGRGGAHFGWLSLCCYRAVEVTACHIMLLWVTCIDEQWRRLHTDTHTKIARTHARPNRCEITAVLSCYAPVAPSSQITYTHTHTHTWKCETGTVTPDLAGSEGHRGIVAKLPSNKYTAHIISSVICCLALTTSECMYDEYINSGWVFCTCLKKCVQCAAASLQTSINLAPLLARHSETKGYS